MISIATDKPVITLGDKIKISVYVKDQDGAPLDLSNVIRHYTGGVVVGTFIPGERVYQAETDYYGYFVEAGADSDIYLIDISGESEVGEELLGMDSGASYTPDAQTTAQSDVTLLGFSDTAQEMVIDEDLTSVDAERGHFTTPVLETDAWPLGLYTLRAIINQPIGADVLTENSRSDHLIVRS
ncbi:MAG: hypothetical protein WC455_09625 [Dehalococcoidia bacterium]